MPRLSEKRDVQDALVNHLIGIGWEYLPDEIMETISPRKKPQGDAAGTVQDDAAPVNDGGGASSRVGGGAINE